jgi:hypothetical protein
MGSSKQVCWSTLLLVLLFSLAGCASDRDIFHCNYPNENAKLVGFQSGSDPHGFGGIEWETDVSTLKGLELYRKDKSHGGIVFYIKKKGEALRIGGESFENAQYGFWNGKFYVGMIETDGLARWNILKKAIFNHYGEGAKVFKNMEDYLWNGEDVIMALRYNDYLKTGIFYIRYEPCLFR